MADPRKSRLPRRVLLLGYVIPVHLVSQRELQAHIGEAKPLEGLWDDDQQAIYIYRGLSLKKKRIALWHELSHALIDLRDRE